MPSYGIRCGQAPGGSSTVPGDGKERPLLFSLCVLYSLQEVSSLGKLHWPQFFFYAGFPTCIVPVELTLERCAMNSPLSRPPCDLLVRSELVQVIVQPLGWRGSSQKTFVPSALHRCCGASCELCWLVWRCCPHLPLLFLLWYVRQYKS